MYSAYEVASYICNRYRRENGKRIDEMKLHKLLYFAQRESLVQNDKPLFWEDFEAWKYGPVLKEIREHYRDDSFDCHYYNNELNTIMDKVFEEYSHILSWSLSMISHGEISWKKARIGIADYENGHEKISIENIRLDAERVRKLRGL